MMRRSPAYPMLLRRDQRSGRAASCMDPQWSYYQSGAKPPGVVCGVAFRPGVAGGILGVPIAEFTDRHVPIDALWG